jgi:hypothetical protein
MTGRIDALECGLEQGYQQQHSTQELLQELVSRVRALEGHVAAHEASPVWTAAERLHEVESQLAQIDSLDVRERLEKCEAAAEASDAVLEGLQLAAVPLGTQGAVAAHERRLEACEAAAAAAQEELERLAAAQRELVSSQRELRAQVASVAHVVHPAVPVAGAAAAATLQELQAQLQELSQRLDAAESHSRDAHESATHTAALVHYLASGEAPAGLHSGAGYLLLLLLVPALLRRHAHADWPASKAGGNSTALQGHTMRGACMASRHGTGGGCRAHRRSGRSLPLRSCHHRLRVCCCGRCGQRAKRCQQTSLWPRFARPATRHT